MLECGRHALDFILGKAVPHRFITPFRYGFPDLCRNCLCPLYQCRKYPPTSKANSRGAVVSSSLIAVLRMRGLMSVGTGLRS